MAASTILVIRNKITGKVMEDDKNGFFDGPQKFQDQYKDIGGWNIWYPEERVIMVREIVKQYKIPIRDLVPWFGANKREVWAWLRGTRIVKV